MDYQPHTIRFSLRAIFIDMSLVGIGVLTLKYPYYWVLSLVNLAVAFSIVFALISALAGTGNRRLFHATYGLAAVTVLLMTREYELSFLPIEWLETIYSAIHSEYGWSVESVNSEMWFVYIAWRWEVVVLSTAAAYTIPWLATLRNTAPQ
jgi:hypothetical protein